MMNENIQVMEKNEMRNLWDLFMSDARLITNISDVERLGMWFSFLLWHKEGKLSVKNNYDGVYSIVELDRSLMEVTSIRILEDWQSHDIYNECLVAESVSDSRVESVLTNYRKLFNNGTFYFDVFSRLNKYDITTQEYLDLADLGLNYIGNGIRMELMDQPKEISELMALLVGNDCKSIFDPFAGLMTEAKYFPNVDRFLGFEYKDRTCELGIIRNAIAGLSSNYELQQKDALNWTNEKFDAIVSMPPFGLRDRERRYREVSDILLDKFENTTTSKGKLVYITTANFLSGGLNENRRKDLVDKNFLDTVVLLPNALLKSTGIALVLVCTDKGRIESSPVRIINGRNFITEANAVERVFDITKFKEEISKETSAIVLNVSNKQIKGNDYRLNFDEFQRINHLMAAPGYEIVKLKDLMERAVCDRDAMRNPNNGYFVSSKDLSDSPFENLKLNNLNTFAYLKESRPISISERKYQEREEYNRNFLLTHYLCYTEPVLLISRIGKLRTGYYNASKENPLFVNRNTYAFRVKAEKVDVAFLRYEISKLKDYFLKVASFIVISIKDIYNAAISIPIRRDDQLRLLDDAQETENSYQQTTSNLMLKLSDKDSEYKKEVENRQHTMNRFLQNMRTFKNNFIDIIEDGYIKDEFVDEVKDLVDNFSKSFDKLSAMVDALNKPEIYGESKRIDIFEFIDKKVEYDRYEYKINNDKYLLMVSNDESSLSACGKPHDIDGIHRNLFVEMDPKKLDEVYDNIINNAVCHGFTDEKRKDYFLEIRVGANVERNMLQIDFRNNGTPLPEGLDKNKFGQRGVKVGKTGNTGIGGSTIKRVMEHYNGDYDIFSDGPYTIVRLLIPFAE